MKVINKLCLIFWNLKKGWTEEGGRPVFWSALHYYRYYCISGFLRQEWETQRGWEHFGNNEGLYFLLFTGHIITWTLMTVGNIDKRNKGKHIVTTLLISLVHTYFIEEHVLREVFRAMCVLHYETVPAVVRWDAREDCAEHHNDLPSVVPDVL